LLALPLGGAAAGPLQAQTAQFAGAVTALGGSFNQPQGVGVDKNRNVYVADTSNGLVEEIPLGCTSQNCVTTLGGGLNQPRSVAVDTSGNVYVADFANQAVYEMPAGCTSTNYNNNLCTITTLVDEKRAPGNTLIGNPAGVAVDGSGNVYFADFNHVY
jgi:sugar lactone lactonase YvrE